MFDTHDVLMHAHLLLMRSFALFIPLAVLSHVGAGARVLELGQRGHLVICVGRATTVRLRFEHAILGYCQVSGPGRALQLFVVLAVHLLQPPHFFQLLGQESTVAVISDFCELLATRVAVHSVLAVRAFPPPRLLRTRQGFRRSGKRPFLAFCAFVQQPGWAGLVRREGCVDQLRRNLG